MTSLALALTAAVTAAIGLAGCAHPATPTRPAVEAALRSSGFSAAEAKCVSDRLFAVLTPAELAKVAKRGLSGVPSARSSTLSTELSRCAGTVATTVPATTTISPGVTTTSTVTTTAGGGGSSTSAAPAGSDGASSTSAIGGGTTRPIPASTGRAR
ncbi:MAG: hypothetical protein JWN46_2946 [Acidimicrobiales bacterium]|nr:hypothetical protein [Acidimicrobiales bacterium]